ncbi:MAG TPA: FliM/FliN family flagellar motor switch protein, partial [Mycoplana sp.]|nr:FliM/FliN family flagellar motor switch protein [Mycoplana sp.]
SEQMSEQVKRSKVTLEARIRLERQTLDTIARLQAGDVIPFHDSGDVRVDVSANGSKLYVCEFGRSGARYTVRVKDTYGSEDELLQHIVG